MVIGFLDHLRSRPFHNLAGRKMLATYLVSTLILAFCHVLLASIAGRLRSRDDSECTFHKMQRDSSRFYPKYN